MMRFIFFSGVVVLIALCSVTIYFFNYREAQSEDSRYDIVAIVQYCYNKEWLKTAILSELLELSIDSPTNLYRFNVEEAKQKLAALSIFKFLEIKKIKPGTLNIEYSLRQPVAYLGNYSNTAIDESGVLIPFKPFYTPKNIPILIGGFQADSHSSIWGNSLKEPMAELVYSLLKLFKTHFSSEGCLLQSLDISKAFENSFGQREIVVVLEEKIECKIQEKNLLISFPRTLRLTVEDYPQQLANYLTLRSYLNKEVKQRVNSAPIVKAHIIDMRIPKLAYIQQLQ